MTMKYIVVLLVMSLFVSCTKNSAVSDKNDGIYWSNEQLFTSGLNLFPFVPFTETEMKALSYDEKLKRRQIPPNFLHNMTSKDLFYQFVYCDLSKSMGLFNTMQQGFESVTEQLNMLPELLNRPDAGHVLLGILQKIEIGRIEELNGFWLFHCLQIILAQSVIINSMTDGNIDNYIQQQMRCHEIIRKLSATNNNWKCPESVGIMLFGLGNVMIRYEFDPFMQLLETNQYCGGLMTSAMIKDEQTALIIIDYIKNFKEQKK